MEASISILEHVEDFDKEPPQKVRTGGRTAPNVGDNKTWCGAMFASVKYVVLLW